jgi:hypothetical protein
MGSNYILDAFCNHLNVVEIDYVRCRRSHVSAFYNFSSVAASGGG